MWTNAFIEVRKKEIKRENIIVPGMGCIIGWKNVKGVKIIEKMIEWGKYKMGKQLDQLVIYLKGRVRF